MPAICARRGHFEKGSCFFKKLPNGVLLSGVDRGTTFILLLEDNLGVYTKVAFFVGCDVQNKISSVDNWIQREKFIVYWCCVCKRNEESCPFPISLPVGILDFSHCLFWFTEIFIFAGMGLGLGKHERRFGKGFLIA